MIAVCALPVFLISPLFLIERLKKFERPVTVGLFVGLQFPLHVFNMGDAQFFSFIGRRSSFQTLYLFRELQGKFWESLFINAGYTVLCLFLTFVFFFLLFKDSWYHKIKLVTHPLAPMKKWIGNALVFFLLFVLARGGVQTKPLNFAHAQVFANPALNNLVLNSGFTMLNTINKTGTAKEKYFTSDEEMLSYLNGSFGQGSLLTSPLEPSPNIVLIILESFGLEYMGKIHGDEGYTPFLDELADKSIFFKNAFASGRRSIEGMGAIFAGIPNLMDRPFISSEYMSNYFWGLGSLLAEKNYHSAFFHGAANGTMYFDQFMKSAGVKQYFGLNEYPKASDHDGSWGIWDEPYLQWAATEVSKMPAPFFATIFTLSSHHPYRVPEQYKGRFKKGDQEINESIGYADFALRKFFESAQNMPWYKNTIFILTADHTFHPSRARYKNELGKYRVPILIYSPGLKLPSPDQNQIVSHIDIQPTVLELAGVRPKEKNFLARSLFSNGPRTVVIYVDNTYWIIGDQFFLQQSRDKFEAQMYSLDDPAQQFELQEPAQEKERLMKALQATRQYFSQGMWDNRLYFPLGR